MIILINKFKLLFEARYQIFLELNALALESNTENGCIRYNFYRNMEENGMYILLGIWETMFDYELHASATYTKTFHTNADKILVEKEISKIYIHDENGKNFLNILSFMILPKYNESFVNSFQKLTQNTVEQGCLYYDLYKDFKGNNKYIIFEKWKTKQDFDIYSKNPNSSIFMKDLINYSENSLEIHSYNITLLEK